MQSDRLGSLVDQDVDPTALDAALAFVDDYELSDTDDALNLVSATTSNEDIVSPHDIHTAEDEATSSVRQERSELRDPRTTSPPILAVRSARTRRRDELAYLRSVVDGLQDQLTVLKKGGEETSVENKRESEEPLAFVWEELATRQYVQRQRAEVENATLRTMLEDQIRVAKNLERLLKKRTSAEFLLPSGMKRLRKSGAVDHESVFDDLMAMIAEMHPEVDTIFADERFACTTLALRDHHARNDNGDGPVVEVFDSQIKPFDMHSVSDAMWYHLSMQSFDRNVLPYELVEFNDECFKLEYRSTLELPRHKGSFHGKIAARRFVEDDRVLILWAALVDPDTISGSSMDGVFMRQKGWAMVRRPPPAYEKPGRPVSLAQMYHIIIPEFHDHENQDEQRRKVGTLTQFVMSTVDFHVDIGRTIIENLLLNDGWKTTSTTASSPVIKNYAPVRCDA